MINDFLFSTLSKVISMILMLNAFWTSEYHFLRAKVYDWLIFVKRTIESIDFLWIRLGQRCKNLNSKLIFLWIRFKICLELVFGAHYLSIFVEDISITYEANSVATFRDVYRNSMLQIIGLTAWRALKVIGNTHGI